MSKQHKSAVAEADAWVDALNDLRLLGTGWDGANSEAPNEESIYWAGRALALLRELHFQPTRVGASVEGGATISFMDGDRYADIECFNSGEILAVISDQRGKPDVWTVPAHDAEIIRALERIRE